MDWFAWLSKSDLDPSLAHKYALTFTCNELERDDISHFSHEFLQSMGISLAKHRLEIIKMARKEKGSRRMIHPINWFVFALEQTKNYLAKHVKLKTLVRRESSSKFPTIVPKRNNSLRWKVAMLQRNKGFMINSAEPKWLQEKNDHKLMLTYGSCDTDDEPHSNCDETEFNVGSNHIAGDGEVNCNSTTSFSSTVVHSLDGEYWSSSTEEIIKWDSMFGNLKPT